MFQINRVSAIFTLALSVAVCSAALPESGQFLKPSSFAARAGEKVRLSVYSGGIADTAAEEWPGKGIEWLYVRVAGTQRNLHGANLKPAGDGDRFFELTLEHAGATLIGMDRKSAARLWKAAEVAELLQQTPESGPDSRPTTGKSTRIRQIDSSKILLSVEATGAQKEGHSGVPQSKSGQIAEIRLMADPLRTPIGSDLPMRVYLHGSSRGGAIVSATNAKSGETRRLVTNASGMATLKLSHAGVWQLKCRHVEKSDAADADWTSFLSTFTFEIPEGSRP